MKITTYKQLYIANLQINKHSYTLRFLKSSIPYSQALRLKTICSTTTEFDKNCAIIKQTFLDQQCREEVLDEQIKKVNRIEKKNYSKVK